MDLPRLQAISVGPSTSLPSSDPPEPKEVSKDSKKTTGISLSPKMQRSIKLNETQILYLSERANGDKTYDGPLWKKSHTSGKWQLRYFLLYQNLLFYYESKDKRDRPLGVIFLEGSYIDRVIYTDPKLLPPTPDRNIRDRVKANVQAMEKQKEKKYFGREWKERKKDPTEPGFDLNHYFGVSSKEEAGFTSSDSPTRSQPETPSKIKPAAEPKIKENKRKAKKDTGSTKDELKSKSKLKAKDDAKLRDKGKCREAAKAKEERKLRKQESQTVTKYKEQKPIGESIEQIEIEVQPIQKQEIHIKTLKSPDNVAKKKTRAQAKGSEKDDPKTKEDPDLLFEKVKRKDEPVDKKWKKAVASAKENQKNKEDLGSIESVATEKQEISSEKADVTESKTKSTPKRSKNKEELRPNECLDRNFCFQISFGSESVRVFEFFGIDETDTMVWIQELEKASFSKQHLEMQKVTAKHLHIIQVVEAEQTAKWQFSLHCEDMHAEMRFLREELTSLKRQRRVELSHFVSTMGHTCMNVDDTNCLCCLYEDLQGDEEKLSKLKKVQSFFRGWLCRRKWKQIVEQYIRSPHADCLRRRNNVVVQLVESEEEYIQQMEVLVTCFLRPFKMAASSKKPPCTHDDVNSIFLNAETVFFLHQIFLKGLTARLENWPTLILGDLFSMLLPMLSIYQEYVRNHHYSLQVLTECKQNPLFHASLERLESKPVCNGRSLETFLTYPMHQIPRYIITLHELLAHTPYEHVERKSLEAAQVQLEKLSKQMHDEVSETENLRKNLAVERMIVEGCDILLDVKQIFVRQGTLIQIRTDKQRDKCRDRHKFRAFNTREKADREASRQCFLFTYHLIITSREQDGKLHLVPVIGKLPMSDAILIEEPSEECSFEQAFGSSSSITTDLNPYYQGRDFKLVLDNTLLDNPVVIHFVAPTVSDKAAWISDIAGCIDNAQFSEICKPMVAETSSINLPQYIKNDPRLFHDEADIRFSKTLNSCKIPHIKYATPDRLLERLTDLRFLSIDFLNTFLMTYKVFTTGYQVLTSLKRIYYASLEKERERMLMPEYVSNIYQDEKNTLQIYADYRRRNSMTPVPLRRTSGASSVSGYCSETSDTRDRSLSYDFQNQRQFRNVAFARPDDGDTSRRPSASLYPTERKRSTPKTIFIKVDSYEEAAEEAEEYDEDARLNQVSRPGTSSTSLREHMPESLEETEIGIDPCKTCGQGIPSEKLTIEQRRRYDLLEEKRLTRKKLNDRRISELELCQDAQQEMRRKSEVIAERKRSILSEESRRTLIDRRKSDITERIRLDRDRKAPEMRLGRPALTKASSISIDNGKISEEKTGRENERQRKNIYRQITSPRIKRKEFTLDKEKSISVESEEDEEEVDEVATEPVMKPDDVGRSSIASVQASTQVILGFFQTFYQRTQKEGDRNEPIYSKMTPAARASFQIESATSSVSRPGVIISGIKRAKRRSSSSYASTAFAIATCAADNPISVQYQPPPPCSKPHKTKTLEHIISTAATMRVLNVLRHWVSKQGKDFKDDHELKRQTREFLDDIRCNPNLTSAEHKSAAQLIILLDKQDEDDKPVVDLVKLLSPPLTPNKETIYSLSALEIAEQLTYLDHQIFIQIAPEELMGVAWMKADKDERAPHIVMMTKRFNDVSRLIATEILKKTDLTERAETIEKWAAVADIVRCLHNFNGILQICSAFTNAAIFRLKTTWDKVSKTAKKSIESHQKLVSSDCRFRSLREALHKCDPPCIPYLGVYLTDLSLIEEGTPNFIDNDLLNFSKMRMIAHIIREIRQFQQSTYRIDLVTRVSNYLLDTSSIMTDDELYVESLKIEPRQARLTSQSSIGGLTPW